MIRVAGEGTDGLAWLESDSRFHGPVGSGRAGVGRRSEGASAKAMPATALNAPWRSASLVRIGDREQAIRFLQETRGMSNKEAAKRVAGVAAELGLK
jgi:hypothetical protein